MLGAGSTPAQFVGSPALQGTFRDQLSLGDDALDSVSRTSIVRHRTMCAGQAGNSASVYVAYCPSGQENTSLGSQSVSTRCEIVDFGTRGRKCVFWKCPFVKKFLQAVDATQ